MFIALDKQGNRVHADDAVKSEVYFCQKCGKEVEVKQGKERKWHFAHKVTEDCTYGKDDNRMSDWHIRMQECFPVESREYRFKDKDTGEVHIADVYIESYNTILEFQHSRIEEEEFLKRTWFHLNNNRRVVWLFDESNENSKGENYRGRLKFLGHENNKLIKKGGWYKWLGKRRAFLNNGPSILEYNKEYYVFIYAGDMGDTYQRILKEDFFYEEILLSENIIEFSKEMNIESLFHEEIYFKHHNEVKVKNQHLDKYNVKIGDTLYFKQKNNKVSFCRIEDFIIEEKIIILSTEGGVDHVPKRFKGSVEKIGKTIFKSYDEAKSSK